MNKLLLDCLFPYDPTHDDLDALEAVREFEDREKARKLLRGRLSRLNYKLDSMRV
jgi:hypothetical protein